MTWVKVAGRFGASTIRRAAAAAFKRMTIEADLHIAEIPYESGAIKFRYARVMSTDKTRWIRHGLFVAYHENGAVASEGQYVDGMEEGLWREFHPGGQPAAEGHYRGGKEIGVWRLWKADGTEEPSTNHDAS